jgi:hypothetical protein
MKKSGLIALSAMLVAGSALASNTGFKLNYPLKFTTATASNQNWMSAPTFYFPNGNVSVALQNAVDMCKDLNDFVVSNPPAKVLTVGKWDTVNEVNVTQQCVSNKNAFNLVAGEGYAVVPVAANIVVNIVGSNNDTFAPNKGGTATYPLQFSTPTASNLNWVSVPYHTTADNAVQLCGAWNQQTSNNISQVVKWDTTNEINVAQQCVSFKNAFNLVPGEGYAAVPLIAGQAISWNVY